MDTRLKERLVGAVALVAIIVIVVPELLTGQRAPSHEVTPVGAAPIRTVSFDPAAAQPGSIAHTSAAAAAPAAVPPATTPVPAAPDAAPPAATDATSAPDAANPGSISAAPPTAGATHAGSAETPAAPAPSAAAAARTAPPRPAGIAHLGEGWVVQLGSFQSRDNAERLVASLRTKGYAAFVAEFHGSGRVLFRVRVGPEQDRARADAIAARLLAHERLRGSVAPEP